MHAYMIREPERAYENPLLAGRESTTEMYATTRTEPLEWNAPSLTGLPPLTGIRDGYFLMPGSDGKGPQGRGRRDEVVADPAAIKEVAVEETVAAVVAARRQVVAEATAR